MTHPSISPHYRPYKMMINRDLSYLILRAALNDYQQSPVHLGASQLAKVEAQARYQYDLQVRILASPEAQETVVSSSQLERAAAEVRKYYSTDQEFHQDLSDNGMDYTSFRQALYHQVQADIILQLVGDKASTISDLDAKIYYYMHLDQFQQPEIRIARQILIAINPQHPESTRRAARKRLFSIATRLRRKPQSFAEQAKKHSECHLTAPHGGLMGQVMRGQLNPQLEESLFSMQEKQISKIIETPSGFHLLFCEKIYPASPMPFEEAQLHILEKLQQRRRQIYQNNWLKQLQLAEPVT